MMSTRARFGRMMVRACWCLAVCVVSPVLAWGQSGPSVLEHRDTLNNPTADTLGFGYSVAGHGDTMVIGAPLMTQAGLIRGMAAIYRRIGGTWTHEQTLRRPDDFGFGGVVAIHGDTVVIARLRYGQGGMGTFVYVRTGGTWVFQSELVPSGSAHASVKQIAVEDDIALISYNSGAVYVFVRTGTVWTEQVRLKEEEGTLPGWPSGASVGAIALSGGTALIGSPLETVGSAVYQGAAHVFVRSGTTWTHQARLVARTGNTRAFFGSTLALSGNTALVAPRGAHLFTRTGTTWTEESALPLPPKSHPASPPYQASYVTLSGATAVVSVRESNAAPAVTFVYRKVGNTWVRMVPSTPAISGFALFGNTILAGDWTYGHPPDENPQYYPGPGIAYVYAVPDAVAPQAPSLSGAVNGTNVTLNWTPASTGPAPATYVVQAGTGPGMSNFFDGNVGGVRQVSATLGAGRYFVRVRAVNAFGASDASNEVVLNVGPPVAPVPGAPVLAGTVNGTTVSLSWTPTAGGTPTSYVLEAGTTAGASNVFNGNVGGGTQLAATVTPGTYHVRVRGLNTGGVGPVSNELILTAICQPPAVPTGLAYSRDGNLVTVRWHVVSGAAEYFLLAGTSSNSHNLYNGTVGRATTVADRLPAGTYYVRVRGVNSCGPGAPSSELVIVVP